MVTLLKDYEQQTYFLNTGDSLDGIVFRNGDMALLMDRDVLLIYDEEGNNWYPVPTGGGGGGGWQLLASGTYTLATSGSTMTIPVTETDNPALYYVERDGIVADVKQTHSWSRLLSAAFPTGMDTSGRLLTAQTVAADGTTKRYLAQDNNNSAIVVLSGTTLTCREVDSSNLIRSGTYNWYIWGM